MDKLMSLALVICFGCFGVVAQTPRPTTPGVSRVQPAPRGASKQWEYLVVSFGKTRFSDPNSEPETKAGGLSKLLSYSKLGVVSASEALTVQWQMDTLGKFGWELVGIVGAIGGDQQMVFRRAYDPEQSKSEAALIREEGERLLAAQRDIVSEVVQAEFIDLDANEKAAAIALTRQKEEERLKKAIESINNPAIMEVRVVSSASSPTDSEVNAYVVVDGTAQLLKEGNKYRSSEAQALGNQVASAIHSASGLTREYGSETYSYLAYATGEVKVSVAVRVSAQGKQKVVATSNTGGKWPERKRGY